MNNSATLPMETQADGNAAGKRRILDSLQSRSRTTQAKAEARSRLVRRLRYILPMLGLVLFGALLFNTRSNPVDQAFLDDFADLSATTEELRMANPRFAGIDNNGRPFEITALSARQAPNEKEIIALDMPRAVQGENERTSVVTAKRGIYRSQDNILVLRDSVTLEHDFGDNTFVLRSPEAIVSIKDEIVVSETGVGAEAEDGSTLKADKMTAYNYEGRVVFEGNVSMRIIPKAAGERKTPDQPENKKTDGDI